MNATSSALRVRLLAGVATGAAMMVAAPAFAQSTATQSAGDQAPATVAPTADPQITGQTAVDQQTTNGGDIVVTGSRIPQSANLTSVAPVTVVTNEELRLQGTTRVEDLLNSLPQVFASQASTISNGSDGTATVNLRGLGPQRTLVLINGRRLVPGDPGTAGTGGSSADLNAIPSSLVRRVEVLTGGASSTYGADAVAGVVNFIMDTEFTGVRVDGQYSLYNHGNSGDNVVPPLLARRRAAGFSGFDDPAGVRADGGTVDASITMGAGFDDNRGHVVGYFGYRKVNPVLESNRDYSACTIQNTSATAIQCGGSATSTPGNVVLYNGGTSTFFQITPGRTLAPGLTRYNFAPTNYFQRPDERYTAGFFAHYDISPAIRPYAEFQFMDDRSLAQIAPSGDFGNTLSVNCDNPLISAQQRSIICAGENLINGFLGSFPLTAVTNPGAAPINFIDPVTGQPYNRAFFQLLRRNVEGGPRIADFEHTSYRGVVGTRGDLSNAFSYDAYYQYGRTVYSQTYRNEFSVNRLNNALDVVTGPGGTPICRSVETGTDPNCVPFDIFGTNVTPAAVNYLSATGFQRGVVSEQVASGSLTGQLGQYGFKMPWATDGFSFNIGAEYRREAINLDVDQEFATGDLTGQGGPTLPISGSYHVVEGFGEVQLPIVQQNFIDNLTLTAGYRYSSYTISNGRHFNTDTYKFGVEFAPVHDIRFRASYNRAVRAPSIQELFATQHVALDGSTDPCAGRVITAADVGCIASGLAVGQQTAANPAGQYNGLQGGTQTLTPERATTKSFGVVLQPRFLPGFAASVDYFDIRVRNAIQSFGADAIINTCVATQNPLACSLVHRNPVSGSLWLTPDGYITDINQNIGSVHTRGIDVNVSYTHRIGGLGTLSASMVGTYLDTYTIDNGLSQPFDCAGFYGVTCSDPSAAGAPLPRWRHKARLSFQLPDGIGLSAQWRYFSQVRVDYSSSNPSLNAFFYDFGSRIGSQSYFDLAATFNVGDHYTFRLGADNILDRQPPLVTSGNSGASSSACPTGPCNGNTYPAVYDALGRYLFAAVTLRF